ncbi:MAG: hypothetical protein ACK4RS_01370, partial [Thiothrix sp.]
MSQILPNTRVMFNDGVNFGTVANMVVAGNSFNKGVLGDYTTVKARYGSSTPQVGSVVIHNDKFYRLDNASAFANPPPGAGWVEVSASTGGMTSVAVSAPLTGNGNTTPLSINMNDLATALAGTGLTASGGKLNVA